MNAPINTVFTIGHSTHSAETFLSLLQLHGVNAVADVRSSPYSRFNPQFNRENLSNYLKSNGIEYVYLGRELGARSDDRSIYIDGQVQYNRLAETTLFKSGIDRILRGSSRFLIALMCAEKEPLECHRSLLVAKVLAERGQPIMHIHADGRLESHEDSLERLFKMTGVSKEDLFRSHKELLSEAMERQEKQIAYVDDSLVALTLKADYQ